MKLSEYQRKLEESKEYTDANNKLKVKFSLANAIYKARSEKGLSQKELANAVGTKQANISRIESGLSNPTLDLITRIADVLDLKIEFSCEKESAIEFMSENMEKTPSVNLIIAFPIDYLAYNLSSDNSETREAKVYA